jgi:hypothetical protein
VAPTRHLFKDSASSAPSIRASSTKHCSLPPFEKNCESPTGKSDGPINVKQNKQPRELNKPFPLLPPPKH